MKYLIVLRSHLKSDPSYSIHFGQQIIKSCDVDYVYNLVVNGNRGISKTLKL